jgi:SAM-dependent methyltransferase
MYSRPDRASERDQITRTPCPVCGSTNTRLYLDDEEQSLDPSIFGSSRTKIAHGRILRCRACGFGFRQVRSNSGEMAELYRKMDVGVYESEAAGRSATASRHMRILSRFAGEPAGRLLDVGCASGLFLREASRAGWSVAGVEPSETLYARAKAMLGANTELHCCILEQANFASESFYAITLWDVLEHVPEPVEFVKTCAALLKPGGKLILNVPDLESREARLLGKRWPLLLAEHLNYFTRGSLRVCGEKAGLKWMHFGRRHVSFSVDYILFRLSQHRIPGTAMARKVARPLIKNATVPIYLGETYAVWSR